MANRTRREAGEIHGRLTLVRTAVRADGIGGWVCSCSCGNETFVRHDGFKSTKSCGCLRKELARARQTTHGATKTTAYAAWHSMKQRCCNPKHKAYHNYGGRGITVCDRWLNSSAAFLEDMGPGAPGLELDRIDNNQGYSPDNCRWVTRKINANNRRANVVLDGLTLTQAAEISGHSIQVISWRVYKMGMTISEAILTPKLRARSVKADALTSTQR